MTSLSVGDVLDRAADLIEPEGAWQQGSWGFHGECMCAEGAIMRAEGSRHCNLSRSIAFLETLLPKPDNRQFRVVPSWNDAPERTQAEVVAKLREAAAKWRAENGGVA